MNKQNDAAATDAGKSQIDPNAATVDGQGTATDQAPTIDSLKTQLDTALASLKSAEKRIGELNKESEGRRKELDKLQELENERKAASMSAEERLVDLQNQFTQATDQLNKANDRLSTADEVLKKQLDAQFQVLNVPDVVKDAINGRSVMDQLEFLADHAQEFAKSASGIDLDAGKGGKSPKLLTAEDFKGKSADFINANWERFQEAQNRK